MRHRHRPPWSRGHRHGRRPPLKWMLARGVHRHLVRFLLVAALLGATVGALMQSAWSHHHIGPMLCVGSMGFFLLWPLAWFAAVRIAWPMQELARVAKDASRGHRHPHHLHDGPEEVETVATALDGLAGRLSAQLDAQKALLGTVSHELRSPLGRARVLVELAREGTDANAYDALQEEIDAMDRLVGDLLAVSRIDFEAVAKKPLDAAAIAQRACEVSGVDAVVTATDVTVTADATLLVRALVGLLDNARRYGSSPITLDITADDDAVTFTVADAGPGLPDPEQAFEPFWRGSDRPGGTGLGLALVRRIAEVHGGSATAEGSAIRLCLPRG